MGRVLVACGTTYGSTREVAEAVAGSLRERGADVDVLPARDVSGLDGYSGVVLGGALYFFRWHRDARKFLSRFRGRLCELPVAVFGMGPLGDSAEEFDSVRKPFEDYVAKQSWLTPVSVRVFGGSLDPERLRFPHNLPAMRNLGKRDVRDWDDIRTWGRELADRL